MATNRKKAGKSARHSGPAKRKSAAKKANKKTPARKKAVVKKKTAQKRVGRPPKPKLGQAPRRRGDEEKTYEAILGTAGRLVIPTVLRTALDANEGAVLRLRMRGDRMVVSSAASDVEYVQDLLQRTGSSLTIKKKPRGH